MKKLPIGIQTFSKIRIGQYCYVDKTRFVADLANESGEYYFLSRPRRFGKSLFLDTLNQAFSGNKEYFNELYLEDHWDWSVQHPVINISFGGGVIENRIELDARLGEFLTDHSRQYGLQLEHSTIAGRFKELIRQINVKYNQSVVVLVDEYDKPILDNIDKPDIATAIRDGLKNFYSVIKDCDRYLRFVFLTGVSKFSKVNLFSGLNNLEDITLSPQYATICGYTEDEIRNIFSDYLPRIDFESMRRWYDGFNFHGNVNLYNPYDVLLYLKNRELRNYWFETATPGFLIKLLAQKKYYIPDIEHIEASDSILGTFDIDHIEIETLLFQTGYLTIKRVELLFDDEKIYHLSYPNHEVKKSLTDYILAYLINNQVEKTRNEIAMYRALQSNNLDKLKDIFHAFFASIPHDWYRKNQLAGYEGYYASIFYCYFTALGLDVTAEDTTNKGRIDLTVKLDNKLYIMEFKVVESSSDTNTALAQIKQKRYHEKYQADYIYLIGVEFNKEDRNITGYAWEQAHGS